MPTSGVRKTDQFWRTDIVFGVQSRFKR